MDPRTGRRSLTTVRAGSRTAAVTRSEQDGDRPPSGKITGAFRLGEYLSPKNLIKVIGLRGMAKVMRSRMRRTAASQDSAVA